MCDPVSAVLAVTAIAGAVVTRKGQISASKSAKEATRVNRENNEKLVAQEEREFNRQNAKTPNVAGLLAKKSQGVTSQTSLTGGAGVNQSSVPIGTNTLLGR